MSKQLEEFLRVAREQGVDEKTINDLFNIKASYQIFPNFKNEAHSIFFEKFNEECLLILIT